ncbi:hypothetical protein [Flammeovirga kamogawensis]|uniref:Uncharacterized protein n=1 Tax=Flammeovirga kamogawensis TaxID=373891 RepID=A0ABX8GZW8_9BACT|nr:hypothetical protein [Flammeovirga kamogawensis]MBB6459403.1 hypothetical protein [Flammeovirga kamogawensis]QWG08959.1 hypothetical protein KM029_08440 [Flammeovirga kamogawensis]TRX67249.1 hypothetical protein EO216_03485 [Flammeovirga kamogawensis]
MDERVYLDPFSQLTALKDKSYTRQYKGVDVHEYKLGKQLLSVSKIRNFLVASTDALWIEEAIRNNGEKFYDDYYFGNLNTKLSKVSTGNQLPDGVNVWIRPSSVVHWFKRMTDLGTEHPFPSLEEFSNGMMVKSTVERPNEVRIQNYNSLPKDSFQNAVFSSLSNSKDEVYKFMVDDIAFYRRWNTSKIQEFVDHAINFDSQEEKETTDNLIQTFKEKGFNSEAFINELNGDIVQTTITNVDGGKWEHLYFFQLKDEMQFDETINQLRKDYEYENSEKVKLIGRHGFTIYRFPIANLTRVIGGKSFSEQHQATYLLRLNNFVITGGDLPTLTQWLDDWLAKRRWTTQKRYQVLINKLVNTPSEASVVFNAESSWAGILHSLSNTYKSYLEKHRQLILSLNFQVWSLSKDRFEIAGLFSGKLREDKPKSSQKILSKTMGDNLQMPPLIYKNLYGEEKGMVLIDKENVLEGYSFTGDTIYYHEFDSIIHAKPVLVWTNNSVPSLFISQNNQVLQIDKNGVYLSGYPIQLPFYSQVEFTNWLPWRVKGSSELLQDTDGIILATDTLGNIYGLDRKGNLKGNWLPQKTLERLVLPPHSFEANGKNYVVTLSELGKLIVFTELGEYVNGFPMLFKEEVSPQLFITEDATLERSTITFLTSIGDVIEVNGRGEVLRRDKFGDRAYGRSFDLLKDEAKGRSWVIMEQIQGKVTIRDRAGKVLFNHRFKEESEAIAQYFDFGIDAEIVAITFPSNRKTYLFYINGKPYLEKPIRNENEVTMFYNSDIQKFILITSFQKTAEIHTIDRRN